MKLSEIVHALQAQSDAAQSLLLQLNEAREILWKIHGCGGDCPDFIDFRIAVKQPFFTIKSWNTGSGSEFEQALKKMLK